MVAGMMSWCWWPDSNGRPTDYESVALPAELHQRIPLISCRRSAYAASGKLYQSPNAAGCFAAGRIGAKGPRQAGAARCDLHSVTRDFLARFANVKYACAPLRLEPRDLVLRTMRRMRRSVRDSHRPSIPFAGPLGSFYDRWYGKRQIPN